MSSAALTRARALLQSRRRRESGLVLVEGRHVILEALNAGLVPLEAFAAEKGLRQDALDLVSDLEACDVAVHLVSERELRELAATTTPQGVVAVLREPDIPAEPFATPGLWLLLDRVQDPGNAGTLVRAAEAFGARGVLALKGSVDLWSAKSVRAGQGAHVHVTLLQESPHTTADTYLAEFIAAEGEIWVAETGGVGIYSSPRPPARCMLAVGNEAGGIAPEVLAAATRRVSVPQRGRTESLNVAMAASVLLSWMSQPSQQGGSPR